MHSYQQFFGVVSDTLVNNGWKWFCGGIVLTLIIAIRDTPEIWHKIRDSSGRKKIWPLANLILHWLAVLVAVVGALASQMGSDKSDGEIRTLATNLNNATITMSVLETNLSNATNELAKTRSNNLVLRSNVFALEANSKWREITQDKKEKFIKSTKNIGKFGIRIRFGTHDAEVQSFAIMVREMLDSAGFIETNVPPLGEWPPEMNLLYRGGGEDVQIQSLQFLNNVEITNVPVGTNSGIDKVFYVMPDGGMIDADEFRSIISETNILHVVMGEGDVAVVLQETNHTLSIPPLCTLKILAICDPNVTKLWDFIKIRAVFYSMGITTGWMSTTNLSSGTCEIFVNPKF